MIPSSNGQIIDHLPAIYHKCKDLCTLLSVFEAILFGPKREDQYKKRPRQSIDDIKPIVDSIATIPYLFDAHETPIDFVPWLARWVALTHFDGLTVEQQRQLIANIVPLYAERGTKNYLEKILEFFKPKNVIVSIEDQELLGFVVGDAHIGIDSWLERDRPFWFRAKLYVADFANDSDKEKEFVALWDDRIRRVIDLAKPAHTLYELVWQFESN